MKELVQKLMRIDCHRWNADSCVKNVCGSLKILRKVWRWCWTFLLRLEI